MSLTSYRAAPPRVTKLFAATRGKSGKKERGYRTEAGGCLPPRFPPVSARFGQFYGAAGSRSDRPARALYIGGEAALQRGQKRHDRVRHFASLEGAQGFQCPPFLRQQRIAQHAAFPPACFGKRQTLRRPQQKQQLMHAPKNAECLEHRRREIRVIAPGAAGEQFLHDALSGARTVVACAPSHAAGRAHCVDRAGEVAGPSGPAICLRYENAAPLVNTRRSDGVLEAIASGNRRSKPRETVGGGCGAGLTLAAFHATLAGLAGERATTASVGGAMFRFGGWALGAVVFCTQLAHAAPEISFLVDGPQGVRLGFVKAGNEWKPLCADPSYQLKSPTCSDKPSAWFVRYRGRQIGVVSASGWADTQSASEARLLKIKSSVAPHIGARQHIFAGWLDRPVYRPLIVTNTALPDHVFDWGPVKFSFAVTAPLFYLRKKAGNIPNCGKDGEPMGAGRQIQTEDIRIFDAWGKSNEFFYGAAIRPELVSKCNFAADVLQDVWLYGNGDWLGPLPALFEDEVTHAFIDAGDFAGDGNEEFLFALSGYDEDGFILYYDSFRKSARIAWHYH
jgi:hypothetical protein